MLAIPDLNTLINDLQAVRNIGRAQINKNHDDQVKYLIEQLEIIFTRAHFDGINTVFHSMNSSIGRELSKFIDLIERSSNVQLTDSEKIIIESYIENHLASLVKRRFYRSSIYFCYRRKTN